MNINEIYADVIRACLEGEQVTTRNSVCRRAVCLSQRFTSTPLVTSRRTAWKNALREMQWFLSGSDRLEDLHQDVRPWWSPWADEFGAVTYNYGVQFRRWNGRFDQLAHFLDGLENHPFSRRHVMTTWNADQMAAADCPITNCHSTVIQAFCHADGTLSLKSYQRSADVVVGLPHNWIQTAALQLWLCARTRRRLGTLYYEAGDAHVYETHVPLARQILEATPHAFPPPTLNYRPTSDVFLADDFSLDGKYVPVLEYRAEMIV